jgi:hypothetical protein
VLFAQFWQWLSDRLADYVSVNVAATAAAIEPAAVSLAVIYVMVWGFLHLRGAVEEPVLTGAVRIVRLVVVFGVGCGSGNTTPRSWTRSSRRRCLAARFRCGGPRRDVDTLLGSEQWPRSW